ncbi:MAG: hypothetical protein Q27BPR15_11345 [Rhodobacter sp. CACIA14H1]|nr:MAG: hypothetical protein Q27BPR15_11345 [Rhodobacter sp. CACIA14H1]
MEPTSNETAKSLRALAQRTIDGVPLNLSEAEKVSIATELYRLADAILSSPTTARDLEAQQQAQRRAAWLTRWLERAMCPPFKDEDSPDKP